MKQYLKFDITINILLACCLIFLSLDLFFGRGFVLRTFKITNGKVYFIFLFIVLCRYLLVDSRKLHIHFQNIYLSVFSTVYWFFYKLIDAAFGNGYALKTFGVNIVDYPYNVQLAILIFLHQHFYKASMIHKIKSIFIISLLIVGIFISNLVAIIDFSIPKIYNIINQKNSTRYDMLAKSWGEYTINNVRLIRRIVPGGKSVIVPTQSDHWSVDGNYFLMTGFIFPRVALNAKGNLEDIVKHYPNAKYVLISDGPSYDNKLSYSKNYKNFYKVSDETLARIKKIYKFDLKSATHSECPIALDQDSLLNCYGRIKNGLILFK